MRKRLLALMGLVALMGSSMLDSCGEGQSLNSSSKAQDDDSSSIIQGKGIESIDFIAARTTLNVGESLKLVVDIKPSDASAKSISFASSDESVLYVSNEGVLTAVSKGEAEIACKVVDEKDKEFEKKISFIVQEVAVTGVHIANSNLELALNSQSQLEVEFTPEDATNKKLPYISDNSEVISIDQKGLMKALKIGEANITVRSDSGLFEDTVCFHVVSEYTKGLNEALEKVKQSVSIESQKGSVLKIAGTYQKKGMMAKYNEDTEINFYSNFVNIVNTKTQKVGDDSTKKTSKTYHGVDLDHSRYFNFKMSDVSKGMSEDDLYNVSFNEVTSSLTLDEMKQNASLYYLEESRTYGLGNLIDYYAKTVLANLKLNEDLKKIANTQEGFEITYQGLSLESTPRYVDLSLNVVLSQDHSIKEIHYVTKIYKKSDLDANNLPKANATTNEFKDYLYAMTYSEERDAYSDESFSPKIFYFTSLDLKTYYRSDDLDDHKYFTVGNTIEVMPIHYSPASASASIDTISVLSIDNVDDNGAVVLSEEGSLKAAKIGKSIITFKTLSGIEVLKEVEVVDKSVIPNGLTEITIDGESKSYLTGYNSLTAGATHVILFKFNPTSGSQEFTLSCDDEETVLTKVDGGFTIARANKSSKTINVVLHGPYDYTLKLKFTFR